MRAFEYEMSLYLGTQLSNYTCIHCCKLSQSFNIGLYKDKQVFFHMIIFIQKPFQYQQKYEKSMRFSIHFALKLQTFQHLLKQLKLFK